MSTLRRTVAQRAGPCFLLRIEAPAPNSSLSSQERQRLKHLRLILWKEYLHLVRLSAALGCSAQPCLARLTLKHTAHILNSGGASRVQAAQTVLYSLLYTTPAFAVRLTTSKAT
jgi:hypothetical protein